jgi:hypothetical protein
MLDNASERKIAGPKKYSSSPGRAFTAFKYLTATLFAIAANGQIPAYMDIADRLYKESSIQIADNGKLRLNMDMNCDCYVSPYFSVIGPRPRDSAFRTDYEISRDQAQPVKRNVLERLGIPLEIPYVVRTDGKYVMEEHHWNNYYEKNKSVK